MKILKKFDQNNYEFNSNSKIGIYMIHGFSSTTYELKEMSKFLADKNYHVILNNLPGHGTNLEDCNKTKYQDWLDYSKIELAKLCSTSDHVFIVGCSMGGVIALYLASIFPLTGLIVGGVVLKFKLNFNTNYLNRLVCRILKTREKKLTFPKEIRDTINFYGYQAYPLIALDEFRKMNIYVKKQLHKITCPILMIHSNNDQVSIKDNIYIINESIQSLDKEILEVENAHHNLFDNNKDSALILNTCENFIKEKIKK
tara:strand:- start:2804 stop:3571 length:768 start_codon:yes stop_codon:yes gene_type:complete